MCLPIASACLRPKARSLLHNVGHATQQTPQAVHVHPNRAPDNRDQMALASCREKSRTEVAEVSCHATMMMVMCGEWKNLASTVL